MAQSDLQSIERLFSDFAFCADHSDAEGLATLFIEDGALCIGDRRSFGRSQIAADCQARFTIPDRKTRHIWSNLRVISLTSDRAVTTALQLTFETIGSATSTRLRVNDVFDELCKDAGGSWRFVNRQIRCELGGELSGLISAAFSRRLPSGPQIRCPTPHKPRPFPDDRRSLPLRRLLASRHCV